MREPQLTRESAGKVLLSAEWHKMAIAYCPLNGNTAKAILSVGSISSSTSDPPEPDGINIQKVIGKNEHRTKPQVVVSQSEPSSGPTVATFAVDVEIPSVYVNLSKPQIDGLQLWADDVAQLLERAFSPPPIPEDSRNTSLIGSRFFAKRGRGSGAETGSTVSGERTDSRSQTVIKVTVTEGILARSNQLSGLPDTIQLLLGFWYRGKAGLLFAPSMSLPLISTCYWKLSQRERCGQPLPSDYQVLKLVQDETVLTLGIMDVTVQDTPTSGPPLTFFALTTPRQLVRHPISGI